MSGAEFDRAYMNMMVSDHNKDVAEFEKESTKGGDPDLKAFAAKTLPTLKEHQQMAKALHGTQAAKATAARATATAIAVATVTAIRTVPNEGDTD